MHKRDFSSNDRLLLLSLFALAIGVISSVGAWALLAAIRFFTNLFFFQTLSLAARSPANHHLGAWVIVVPVMGGLIVGLMARGAPLAQAAVWGITLHAHAGRALAERLGPIGYLARELPREIPNLLDKLAH